MFLILSRLYSLTKGEYHLEIVPSRRDIVSGESRIKIKSCHRALVHKRHSTKNDRTNGQRLICRYLYLFVIISYSKLD